MVFELITMILIIDKENIHLRFLSINRKTPFEPLKFIIEENQKLHLQDLDTTVSH